MPAGTCFLQKRFLHCYQTPRLQRHSFIPTQRIRSLSRRYNRVRPLFTTHIYVCFKSGSRNNTYNKFLVVPFESSRPRHRSCKDFRWFTQSSRINIWTVPQTGTRRHPSTSLSYGRAGARCMIWLTRRPNGAFLSVQPFNHLISAYIIAVL
jgi:hypothetical protein